MNRQLYLLGVGLALMAGALAFTDWALSLRPGVTEGNVRRIRPGMKRTEVEAVLGRQNGGTIIMGGLPRINVWEGECGVANVQFDRHGGSQAAQFVAAPPAPESGPLARLRAWLGW
jgi:hypothetical protein